MNYVGCKHGKNKQILIDIPVFSSNPFVTYMYKFDVNLNFLSKRLEIRQMTGSESNIFEFTGQRKLG